jgi:phosphoserine phosphatase
MTSRSVAGAIVAFLVFTASCPVFAGELPRGRFSERNHAVLERLILENGRLSPTYDAKKRPYVVCDWDNTSAFGDVEETLGYYMLENLLYSLSVSEFRRAVSLNVPQGSSKMPNRFGQPIVFDDLIEDLVENYTWLYKNYRGLAGEQSIEEIRVSEVYKDFGAKLFVMFDALYLTAGAALASQWQGQLMSGMTRGRLEALSDASVKKNLGETLRKVTLTGSDKLERRSKGVFAPDLFLGLRIYPDMGNLYQALMQNGIDVYILSASPEDIVVPIASKEEYGYGVPRENIFGVMYAESKGLLDAALSPDRKMTWGPGKVDLIRKKLIAAKGHPPILVCGDSDGDYDMLSEFPEMKLGLIIDRRGKGKLTRLYEQARKEIHDARPRYILQGIDENTGLFNADAETVKFGVAGK